MNVLERLPLATKDGRGNMIRAFKASGCRECGRRYPELDWSELHIDHIDPRNKPRVSAIRSTRPEQVSTARTSTATLIAELLHCQVLCFDCHKEKHRQPGSAIEGQLSMFNGTGGWRYG